MPITWKSVTAGSNADSARFLEGATASLNTGLDQLTGVLDRRQEEAQQNLTAERKLNTSEYRDRVDSFETVEALQAAQADGTLDAFRTGLGENVDAEAIRGVADSRVTDLRNMANAEYEYGQTKLTQELTPEIEGIKADIAADKPDEDVMARIEASSEDLTSLGQKAGLLKLLKSTNKQEVDDAHDAEQRKRTEKIQKREDALTEGNDSFTALKTKILSGAKTAEGARAQMYREGQLKGIPVTVLDERIGEMEVGFADVNGLTTEQGRLFQAGANQIAEAAENDVAREAEALVVAERAYELSALFRLEGKAPSSVGDVVDRAVNMGFDKTDLWSRDGNLSEGIQKDIDWLQKENDIGIHGAQEKDRHGNMVPKDAAEYSGALAMEALARLGDPDTGWYDDNMDRNQFRKMLQTVYDEHRTRENQRVNLEQLRRETPEKIRRIRSTASTNTATLLNEYKVRNGNLLRGE